MLGHYCNWCNWCKSSKNQNKSQLFAASCIIWLQTKEIIIGLGKYWRWQELLESTNVQVYCIQYSNLSTLYCQLWKIAIYLYVKLWSEIIPDIVIRFQAYFMWTSSRLFILTYIVNDIINLCAHIEDQQDKTGLTPIMSK